MKAALVFPASTGRGRRPLRTLRLKARVEPHINMIPYIRKPQYPKYLQILLIILLCIIIYGPSLRNGFIWDDDLYLYKNFWIQRLDGLRVIWLTYKMPQYYPIVFSTFWLEHKLWGLNPFGYHTVNLVLHILNVLLVFWVVRKLYSPLAFWVALLFAIHPIQVETVAWVTERKNLLSLFFFLLAVLSYLRFDRTRKPPDYLLTVAMFVCALLSKSIAVCFISFPILYKWWRDGKFSWREARLSLPFAAIGIFSAINTIYLELHHVGAKGNEWDTTFLERLILSGRILLFYIHKLCVPREFVFIYPRWTISIAEWQQWLFPLAPILLLSFLFYYRREIGRGAFALFLFYVISIFPALGFVNVYPMKFSFVADHFSYLSTPALLLLLCVSAGFFFDKLRVKFSSLMPTPAYRITMVSSLVIMVIYMCVKSTILTGSYKNSVVLWKDVIQKNPKAWIAYNNLGLAYNDIGEYEEAMSLFSKAIELKPDYAQIYYNLGIAYNNIGKSEEAITFYNKALAFKPDYVEAYNNLGNIYNSLGRAAEAIALHKKAIALNPNHYELHYNLGNAYRAAGRYEEAIASYKKAVIANPSLAIAYNNLAGTYYLQGQYSLAIEYCDRAIELGYKADPSFLKLLEPFRQKEAD